MFVNICIKYCHCRGRPRKVIQPLHTVDDPDSDDGLAIIDTDPEQDEV